MFLKSTAFALIFGAQVAMSPVQQPVFGYTAGARSCALTINGQSRIQLEQMPDVLQPQLRTDIVTLARGLNRASQAPGFDAREIQPVLVNGAFEIRHRDQPLLRLSPAWETYRRKSRLALMLDLSNQLRRQLGAAPLNSYAFLGGTSATQVGLASWYGGHFHGRLTANGERYNIKAFTAAHKKLPFGTRVLVTNLDSKQSVVVKINDRGPFVHERIIDLSPAAFNSIGSTGQGVMRVKLTVLG